MEHEMIISPTVFSMGPSRNSMVSLRSQMQVLSTFGSQDPKARSRGFRVVIQKFIGRITHNIYTLKSSLNKSSLKHPLIILKSSINHPFTSLLQDLLVMHFWAFLGTEPG